MKYALVIALSFSGAGSVHAVESTPLPKKSFEDILNLSLTKSEDIRAKESEVRSAEALLTQSKFKFAPDLNLTGTYTESGADVDERAVGRAYGAKSNLNLFRFGADYFNYRSADVTYQGARWDLQNSKLEWEETIAIKILEVIYRYNETLIRRKLYESQRDYSAIAEKRYAKGILPRQELDKLTIDMGIAEARLKDAETQEYQARENLKVYSGEVDVDTQWPWLNSLKKLKRTNLQFEVENHPQWRFLKERRAAAEYLVKTRRSEMAPSLDLSLSYFNESSVATNYDWSPQWVGAVTLTIPLFSRFESATATKLAFETQTRAELSFIKTTREIEAKWKIAERDFRTQLGSATQREQNLKTSRGLYRDNFQRFQSGRSNANELFNDQDRLYQTELLANQGWYSVHLSYIRLCHSLGSLLAQCQL